MKLTKNIGKIWFIAFRSLSLSQTVIRKLPFCIYTVFIEVCLMQIKNDENKKNQLSVIDKLFTYFEQRGKK